MKIYDDNHAQEKADWLNQFGEQMEVDIGNGANGQFMLKKTRLGIAVLGAEG